MYLPISGNFTVTPPTDGNIVQLEELYLSVDTSGVPCNITLPPISAFGGFLNQRIYVNDRTGNASVNNITVTPNVADTIDGQLSFVIDNDGDGAEIFITDKNDWRTTSGGSSNLTGLWARGAGRFSLLHVNNDLPNTSPGDYALAMGASADATRYAERVLASGAGYPANSLPPSFNEMVFRNRTVNAATETLFANFGNGDSEVMTRTATLYTYLTIEADVLGINLGTGEILQATANIITSAHSTPAGLLNNATAVVVNFDNIGGTAAVNITSTPSKNAGVDATTFVSLDVTGTAGATIDWMAYARIKEMLGNQ